MKRSNSTLVTLPVLAVAAALAGCQAEPTGGLVLAPSGESGGGETGGETPPGPTPGGEDEPVGAEGFAAGEDNTFSHMDDLSDGGAKDPFEILEQRQEEGPPEIRVRLHSCRKLQIRALRNLLEGFGVNLAAEAEPDTAGELVAKGGDALGAANYASRTGEALVWTNAGATKLQDVFVQAAPEIIAAFEANAVPHCQIDGVAPKIFDAADRCNIDALSCLIGRPARADHVAICDHLVQTAKNGAGASDVAKAKAIAVAALLGAAHSCE
jgi:hypothetical protein